MAVIVCYEPVSFLSPGSTAIAGELFLDIFGSYVPCCIHRFIVLSQVNTVDFPIHPQHMHAFLSRG